VFESLYHKNAVLQAKEAKSHKVFAGLTASECGFRRIGRVLQDRRQTGPAARPGAFRRRENAWKFMRTRFTLKKACDRMSQVYMA
jgi:hypothetical protein